MKAKEGPIDGLNTFLPEGTFEWVAPYFRQYAIRLTIKQERKRILGDYRNPTPESPLHKISINGNLNPYAFLITLLHELAHLVNYTRYGHTVASHGREWQENFRQVLHPFITHRLLPSDISEALARHLQHTKATTCSDPDLYKTLAAYDTGNPYVFVDEIPEGTLFRNPRDGKTYRKSNKLRTRYRCIQSGTGHIYLFPSIAEVEVIAHPAPDML